MIPEVDVALRSLIEREATAGTEVEVVFDAPTKDWAGRRNVPTIDVYLYDIREDMRRRERGLINEYDERDRVRARHLPPRHFKLSYMITAWTQRPEDEHRLLAALLSCFLRHDAIPAEFLTGPLADIGLPVPVTVALPPPEDRSFADVWSALGGELKPSLDVVVSAPADTGQQYHAGPPVEQPPTISLGGNDPRGDGAAWPPREERHQVRPVAVALAGGGAPGAASRSAVREAESGAAESGAAESGAAGAGADRSGARPDESGRDRPVAMVRGLSWREFADSGRGAGPSTTVVDADPRSAPPPAAGAGDDAPKPKPRRRRSSGLDQK
ncbi:DUF4255 domain-containing protein [Nakamurella sp.]|uniref:DUF4255 domain-containing protein n=1 Tax=Nakamurella sp. TaxID=1869182 RepID=UPI0037849554